ncbi:Alpha/Beta hydrolase protein [Aspergillus varians]
MAVKDTLVSLGMTTVAAPVILVSLLIRRARSLTSEQGGQLPFKEDLHRSLSSILPLKAIRHHLQPRPLNPILESNRFEAFKDQLCIRVSSDSCNGYWICKGPPGKLRSVQESDMVCLWFHGGAYCFGDPLGPAVSLLRVAKIAATRGVSISIFSVEYTLAPAATFPQQQCEATAAYRHLLEAEGISAERIIIAGDSAGGALLLYPWINLTNNSPSFESNRDKDMISKRFLDRCVEAVIGERGRVEALNLEDLVNPWEPGTEQDWKEILPSFTWVNVGAHDVLLHDVQTFVQRAKAKGAQLELKITPSKPHRWNFDLDKESEDLYCKLRPDDQVPAGMMTGSSTIAEGLLTVLYGGN